MSRLSDTPPLTVHPSVQFGRLCIAGTRLPVDAVGWSVWAENGSDRSGHHGGVTGCADDYEITRNDALMACWWFVSSGTINEVRGERKRKARWVAWAEHAHRVLGGWDKRARTLCDPDNYVVRTPPAYDRG